MVAKGVYEQAVVVAHDVGVGQREVRELLREAVVVDACRDGFLGGERDQGQVGWASATLWIFATAWPSWPATPAI